MSTLKNWVRFSVYNSFYANPRVKRDTQANEWLFDRFRLDTIEDEANLNIKDSKWYLEEYGILFKLCHYYRNWLSQKGINPDTPFHPRFVDCLVIDEAALSALLAQSNPPLGRYKLEAADDDELRSIYAASQADAFVWLLDTDILHNKLRWIEKQPDFLEQCNKYCAPGERQDQGLMQVCIHQLRKTWFARLYQEDQLSGIPCKESPEFPGAYRYAR